MSTEQRIDFDRIRDGLAAWTAGESQLIPERDNDVWILEANGGRYEVAYDVDLDAEPVSGGYSDAELAAWGSTWHFYSVLALFRTEDGRLGSCHLGGVNAGSFYTTPEMPLNEDEQIFLEALHDGRIHEGARADALRQPARPTVQKIKVQDVTEGMNIKLYGQVFMVTENSHEGYKLYNLEYAIKDSGGFDWTGRLALRKGTKVSVVK